jgi:hypothetical protein
MQKQCDSACRYLKWITRHQRYGCVDKGGIPRYAVLETDEDGAPLRDGEECPWEECDTEFKWPEPSEVNGCQATMVL